MKDEEGRVKMIFIVFTATYVSRAVIYLVQLIVYVSLHINGNPEGEELFDTITDLTYCVLYNVWDILPLALIMEYHRTCYAEQRRTLMLLEDVDDEIQGNPRATCRSELTLNTSVSIR